MRDRRAPRIDIELFLRHLGVRAERTGDKWRALCPHPEHEDHDPSWSIVDKLGDKRHGSHYCQSCKRGGGPWELGAWAWGCTVDEAGERIAVLFGDKIGNVDIRIPTVRAVVPGEAPAFRLPAGVVLPVRASEWYEPALDYLTRPIAEGGRGMPMWQVRRWGLGYALRGKLRLRVVIPVYTGGRLLTYTARSWIPSVEPRYMSGRRQEGARPSSAIFGEARFDPALETVTLAEGSFSMLALERAGAVNPGAMLGSELTPERAAILTRFRRIVIASDPDKAGERVAEVIKVFGRRAQVDRLALDLSPDDTPDAELADRLADLR